MPARGTSDRATLYATYLVAVILQRPAGRVSPFGEPARRLAVARGKDPDEPRELRKVTEAT
jgi:hypothetical protein